MRPQAAATRPPGGMARSRPSARAATEDFDPDAPVELRFVFVDGRNVQRAFERGSAPGSMPTRTLIASLRAAFPPPTEVELILDGFRGGSPTGRVSPGLTVQFTRDVSADHVIGDRVAEAYRVLGPAGAWAVLVITDDREVRDDARRSGARVEGTAWLAGRLSIRAHQGPSIGHGRAPRPPRPRGEGPAR